MIWATGTFLYYSTPQQRPICFAPKSSMASISRSSPLSRSRGEPRRLPRGGGHGRDRLHVTPHFRRFNQPHVSDVIFTPHVSVVSSGFASDFCRPHLLFDILPALKGEDSSVGGSATDPRRQLAGSCALLWDFREGMVSPTNRGRPTRIARAVPSA